MWPSLGRRAVRRGLPRPAAQLLPRLRCRALASGVIPGVPRKLDDVVKLELFEKLEPDGILSIWTKHHADKPELAAAAASADELDRIMKRGTESPSFVWPVRRQSGHILLYSQFAPAHSMFAFTFLEDYRRSPELAPPWMSVLLYNELVPTKGIALLRAESDSDRLTKEETEGLLALVRRFYATDDYDKVWAFNHFQRRFDLQAYLNGV
jgi:ATP synthase F1 complex assembly factor 1